MSTESSMCNHASNHEFIYHFSVETEIAQAKVLSENDRASVECNIVDVIYESFVVTADQDYLTARLLARSGLYRAFYWAAAQTIEKYLKAFLLLNGNSVKRGAHGIEDLYAKACAVDSSLQTMDIQPHDLLNVPDYARDHLTVFKSIDFLRDIDKFGRPDNRYNSFGVDFNSGHLFALDQFVFNLRKRIQVPDIWQSMSKVEDGLLIALTENNPWLSIDHDFTKAPVSVKMSMAVTKLDFLVAHIKNTPYMLALQWLNRMMKLPAELSEKIGKV